MKALCPSRLDGLIRWKCVEREKGKTRGLIDGVARYRPEHGVKKAPAY